MNHMNLLLVQLVVFPIFFCCSYTAYPCLNDEMSTPMKLVAVSYLPILIAQTYRAQHSGHIAHDARVARLPSPCYPQIPPKNNFSWLWNTFAQPFRPKICGSEPAIPDLGGQRSIKVPAILMRKREHQGFYPQPCTILPINPYQSRVYSLWYINIFQPIHSTNSTKFIKIPPYKFQHSSSMSISNAPNSSSSRRAKAAGRHCCSDSHSRLGRGRS